MKRLLLSFALLASMIPIGELMAQCSVSNVSITPTNINISNCQLTFNLSYTLDVNNGSKYSVVHLWDANSYPNPAPTAAQYPLPTAQTGTMLGTIVIRNPGGPTSGNNPVTLLNAWPQDGATYIGATPSTPILFPISGFAVSDYGNGPNARRVYNFVGLRMTIPNCTQSVTIKGDIWASQTASQGASCLASGAINLVANEPGMRGQVSCSSPRSFGVSFNTLTSRSITFSAYKDANSNFVFDPADEAAGKLNISGPNIVGATQDVTITSPAKPINVYDNTNTFGPYTYSPQTPGSLFNVWIVATASGNTYNNILLLPNSCAPLPVSFKSFSATRNEQSVSVKWETASEINNRGFNIQSNSGGAWTNLAFVASKANGNSSSGVLSYEYSDLNKNKGITQYRIQQVDVDGNFKYSDICFVQGEGRAKKFLLFPNPSINGKITLSFGEEGVKDVTISDASGRVVQSHKSIRSSSLAIENLSDGFYTVHVRDISSNVISVEKLLVNKK